MWLLLLSKNSLDGFYSLHIKYEFKAKSVVYILYAFIILENINKKAQISNG